MIESSATPIPADTMVDAAVADNRMTAAPTTAVSSAGKRRTATRKTAARKADAKPAAKRPIAARNFTDSDTGRSFKAGKPVEDVKPGVLENYRAAGLIAEPGKAKSSDAA